MITTGDVLVEENEVVGKDVDAVIREAVVEVDVVVVDVVVVDDFPVISAKCWLY